MIPQQKLMVKGKGLTFVYLFNYNNFMNIKSLLNYERSVNALVADFAEKYYDGRDDWEWIGQEVGGCLRIGDEYLNMDLIVSVMRVKPTVEEYFDYYYYQLEEHTEERSPWNLKYWLMKEREKK